MNSRIMRKTLSVLTASLLAATNIAAMPAGAFAQQNGESKRTSASISVLPVIDRKVGSGSAAAKNAALNSILSASGMGNDYFDSLNIDSSLFPKSFDLRETGRSTSVKDQNPFGTCWTFGAMGSIESSLVARNPWIDLSEWQLAYFSYVGENAPTPNNSADIFNEGGWTISAVNTLAQWIGPVSEAAVPYNSGNPADDLRYRSDYHLRDALCLNNMYESAISSPETEEIKHLIYSSQSAAALSFCYSDEFFNTSTNAHFCYNPNFSNHIITVIGWNDNYSRYNFLSQARPKKNGAWLCKNSWGTSFGDAGYFWISYEDESINEACIYSVDSAEKYDNLYSYDSMLWGASISADPIESNSSYMANIFTANGNEDVTAAAFYTTDNNAAYEITVYTGLADENIPTSGTASKITSGTLEIAGYHTVDLDEVVPVKENEKYSVVVKLVNPSIPYPLPVEASFVYCTDGMTLQSYGCTYEKLVDNTQEGQSFISLDGAEWQDTCLMYYDITPDIDVNEIRENIEKTKKSFCQQSSENTDIFDIIAEKPSESLYTILGNVCLKAITNNNHKVSFSIPTGGILPGESVELSANDCDAIYYTLDGTDPSAENGTLYSEPIALGEECYLRAVAIKDGVYGEIADASYSACIEFLSGLQVSFDDKSYALGYNDLVSGQYEDSEISGISAGFACESIDFTPIAAYPITINGIQTTSAHKITLPLEFGKNKFAITVGNSAEYVFEVNRKDYEIDTATETIYFDENRYFIEYPNGEYVSSGAVISDYAGCDFHIHDAKSNEDTIATIPSRLAFDVDEAFIRFNESLLVNFLSIEMLTADIADDLLFIATEPDMSDAENIMSLLELSAEIDVDALSEMLSLEESVENTEDLTQEEIDELLRQQMDRLAELLRPYLGVKIEPGQTLYLRVPANESFLASEVVSFTAPAAPVLSSEIVIDEIGEDSISVNGVEGCEYAIVEDEHYYEEPVENYEPQEYETYASGASSLASKYAKLAKNEDVYSSQPDPEGENYYFWQDSPVFTDLCPGTKYHILMRVKSTDTSYSSNTVSTAVTTAGLTPLAKIIFSMEVIEFNPNICSVFAASGARIAPYADISGYIGQNFTVVPAEPSRSAYTLEIPERPATPEVSINFSEEISNEIIPDNVYVIATRYDEYEEYMIFPSDMCENQEGYFDFIELYGYTLSFYVESTAKSFASNHFNLSVPFKTELGDYYANTGILSANTIEFITVDENAIYSIYDPETETYGEWQSSPVFTGLEANTTYYFQIMTTATDYTFASPIMYTDVTTRERDYQIYHFTNDQIKEMYSEFYSTLPEFSDTITIAVPLSAEKIDRITDENGFIDVTYFGIAPEYCTAVSDENGMVIFTPLSCEPNCMASILLMLEEFGYGSVVVSDFYNPDGTCEYVFPKYSVGDINLDGNVNIADLGVLAKYIAEIVVIDGDALKNSDCNGDGEVDIADLTRLAKYIAEYDVVLGK